MKSSTKKPWRSNCCHFLHTHQGQGNGHTHQPPTRDRNMSELHPGAPWTYGHAKTDMNIIKVCLTKDFNCNHGWPIKRLPRFAESADLETRKKYLYQNLHAALIFVCHFMTQQCSYSKDVRPWIPSKPIHTKGKKPRDHWIYLQPRYEKLQIACLIVYLTAS